MKSIRLSLMVYFLGLLALALGAASWLVYRTANQTLHDKQQAAEKLINAQYSERCRDEEKRLDDQLLLEAQNIYRLTRSQLTRSRVSQHDLNVLNTAGLIAQGPPDGFAMPLWFVGIISNPPRQPGSPPRSSSSEPRSFTSWQLYRPYYDDVFQRPPAIQFNEDELLDEKSHVAEYFQIDASWGNSYRSSALRDKDTEEDEEQLLLNHSQFNSELVFAPIWDTVNLRLSKETVRRVAFRAPTTGTGRPPRSPQGRGESPSSRPSNGASTSETPPRSALYIQCAYPFAMRDNAEQLFADYRDEKLAQLYAETQESLSKLKTHLLGIIVATFAATVAGTWFLVWLGLMPLRQLSDAVSRVSEKDFRLQFDGPRLPAELRPITEHLNGTLQQLKRAFAREKQATADISHELRTPLAALLTTTDLALRKPRTADEYREMLVDCRVSGQQMNRAVERLLALARLDAGVDNMRPERVDVTALAEQCAALVRPLAEARGLHLQVHGGDGAQLLADPDKLREVLTNLLHNAIEYNKPRGSIDVSVQRQNGQLHVAVRDTGIGIPAAAVEHIFERFYRIDKSRGGEDGLHAGLGLAIVKGYVDLMGGTIRVESAEGQGSTFHVDLPV